MHNQRTHKRQEVVTCFAELNRHGEKKYHVAIDQIPEKVKEIQRKVGALPQRHRKPTIHQKLTNVIHTTFEQLSRGGRTALARI